MTVLPFPAHSRSTIQRAYAAFMAALAVGALLLSGCEENPEKPKSAATNTDLPNANHLVVSHRTFGTQSWTSLSGLKSRDDASQWFRGGVDGQYAAGKLDVSGSLLWIARTGYRPRDLEVLAPSSPLPGGAIVVGGFDIDGDGMSEIGYATLFTSNGRPAGQVLYSSDSSDVWLNAIAPLSDSLFIVVGGERTASRDNPLIALLALTPSGLERRPQAVLSSISARHARDVATDPGDAAAATRRVYLATASETGTSAIGLHGIDINAASLSPWSIAWNQTLNGKGVGTWENDMKIIEGALDVVGGAKDPAKGTPAGGGIYWDAGLAASLSLDGTTRWEKVVSATGHSDEFGDIEPGTGMLIAIGNGARYELTDTKETFGYGWVAGLDPSNGNTLASYTIGDANNESGFLAGFLSGSTLKLGGWAAQEVSGQDYRGWWCVMNLSTNGGTPVATRLTPARPGEVPVPDRRAWLRR